MLVKGQPLAVAPQVHDAGTVGGLKARIGPAGIREAGDEPGLLAQQEAIEIRAHARLGPVVAAGGVQDVQIRLAAHQLDPLVQRVVGLALAVVGLVEHEQGGIRPGGVHRNIKPGVPGLGIVEQAGVAAVVVIALVAPVGHQIAHHHITVAGEHPQGAAAAPVKDSANLAVPEGVFQKRVAVGVQHGDMASAQEPQRVVPLAAEGEAAGHAGVVPQVFAPVHQRAARPLVPGGFVEHAGKGDPAGLGDAGVGHRQQVVPAPEPQVLVIAPDAVAVLVVQEAAVQGLGGLEVVVPVVVGAPGPAVEFGVGGVINLDHRRVVQGIAVVQVIQAPPLGGLGHMDGLDPGLLGDPGDIVVVGVGRGPGLAEVPAGHTGRLFPVVSVQHELRLVPVVGQVPEQLVQGIAGLRHIVPHHLIAGGLRDEHHEHHVAVAVVHAVNLEGVVAIGAARELVGIPVVHIVVQHDHRRNPHILAAGGVAVLAEGLVQQSDQGVGHQGLRLPHPLGNPHHRGVIGPARLFDEGGIHLNRIPEGKGVDLRGHIGQDVLGVGAGSQVHQRVLQPIQEAVVVPEPRIGLGQGAGNVDIHRHAPVEVAVQGAVKGVAVVARRTGHQGIDAVIGKGLVAVVQKGDLGGPGDQGEGHQKGTGRHAHPTSSWGR